jgi:hypothetical protein
LLQKDSLANEFESANFESDTIDDLDAQIDAVLERLALRGIEFS